MIKTPNNIMNNGFDTNDYIKMRLNSSELTEISWPLKVNITEFDVIERTLRVTGSTHIGGVMFQLVEQLGSIKNDWSDFALWWPEKNQWLKKTKMTLDQYGVQADALLHFTRIHKHLRVQMPDLQIIDLNVDYSNCLFNTVKQICKEMNIRNAEEISLIRIEQLEDNNKKKNKNDLKMKGNKSNAILNSKSMISTASSVNNYSNKENDQFSVSSSTTSTLNNSSSNNSSSSKCNPRELSHSLSIENNINLNSVSNLSSNNDTQSLHLSPIVPTQFYLNKIAIKYKSLFDKTRINSRYIYIYLN
jgi:kindlin 2